jgi:hypothetical protein
VQQLARTRLAATREREAAEQVLRSAAAREMQLIQEETMALAAEEAAAALLISVQDVLLMGAGGWGQCE